MDKSFRRRDLQEEVNTPDVPTSLSQAAAASLEADKDEAKMRKKPQSRPVASLLAEEHTLGRLCPRTATLLNPLGQLAHHFIITDEKLGRKGHKGIVRFKAHCLNCRGKDTWAVYTGIQKNTYANALG